MSRRRRFRKVVTPPSFKGYKPYGVNNNNIEIVNLLYEEYESIKLSDYDNLNYQSAGDLMGVSRATFARIYDSARKKIAKALVEAKQIETTYGNAIMNKNWFVCNDCYVRFTIPKNIFEYKCPVCISDKIEIIK